MLEAANAPRSNHRNADRIGHRTGEAQVESLTGSVSIHAGEEDFSGTKAFDLVFAEGLWAELHADGVDVLSLVVGATDTPSLRTSLARHGVSLDDLAAMSAIADPADVARAGLTHLADGPTWQLGVPDGAGPPLLGALPRRQAVELMTGGHDALFGAH